MPNATKTILEEIEKNPSFKITNTKTKQEVVLNDGTIAGVVFYEPGKSDLLNGIEVDQPRITSYNVCYTKLLRKKTPG